MRACRICKGFKRQNRYRVCYGCEPRWREKVEKRRSLRQKLNLAYQEFLDNGHPNCCDVCGRKPATRRLQVDHDHKTGKIRGLLCYHCNYGLQWFWDNPELLEKASRYLQRTI